ncbi:alkaline phosphatase family protein [Candidatus Pacearchaeota archaeon]|nr:alkaline phosphatase family protein [Candidatus Pacearchaeota archaeon]
MENKKIIIMLDSFKPEYIGYADYLKEKTKEFQHGELETPLGFWGGMDIFFHGSSDKLAFFYLTERSSWKWMKNFVCLGKINRFLFDVLLNLWNVAKGNTLFRTNNIPLEKFHLFDTDVKKPLHKGIPVKYISFHELDGIAHKYGTKSIEVVEEVKRLDNILSKIKWDMIMSDHGMLDIKEFVKVPETEKCFIDSTLARYWGEKPENMPIEKCKLIKWDTKYGDWIYLANPGVCFFPNYWQMKECKGMHGYNPKLKEMKAFYILNKIGKKKDLTMGELHREIA